MPSNSSFLHYSGAAQVLWQSYWSDCCLKLVLVQVSSRAVLLMLGFGILEGSSLQGKIEVRLGTHNL